MAPSRSSLTGDLGQLIHRSPDNRLEIRRATMSSFPAEAIVNATNTLMNINTANIPSASYQITTAAGPDLLNHLHYNCPEGLRVGDALATPNFGLMNCYYIIHVNGPSYRSSTKRMLPLLKQQLADCYRRCMEEALSLGVKSIAFPCISTGSSLGWPRIEAARIGVKTVRAWLRHPIYGEGRRAVERVFFLADPVGVQAHQEGAWCAAFREVWPQVVMPRRPPRASFRDWDRERRERIRFERAFRLALECGQQPAAALAPDTGRPATVPGDVSLPRRELRRSQRVRKPPQRYGR